MKLEEMPLYLTQELFENPLRMPTVSEVNEYAGTLGVRFPEKYVSFVVQYAGHQVAQDVGYAVIDQLFDGTLDAYLHDIGLFLHYDDERDYKYSVQNKHLFYAEEFGVPDFVPFTSTDVGGEIGFDFSESRVQPKIVTSNIYGGVPDDDDLILMPVAASFDEFVDKLMTRKDFIARYGSNN